MILAATLTLALAVPQLRIEPDRVAVGGELVVRAERAGELLINTDIVAELPDGSKLAIGKTDSSGRLTFVPALPGEHVFRAEVDGVQMVAPCRVVPPRSAWLAAAGCVPLGLALLWRSLPRRSPSRARDRRAP